MKRQRLTYAYKESLREALAKGKDTWEIIAIYYDDDEKGEEVTRKGETLLKLAGGGDGVLPVERRDQS